MKLWGVGVLALGLAASQGGANAQQTGTGTSSSAGAPPVTVPVPVPPPVVMMRPSSAPVAARAKFATLDEEIAKWGRAPAVGSDIAALPVEKKAARAVRLKRGQDRQTCIGGGPMKDWMAAPKLAACDRQLALAADPGNDAWDLRARLLQQRAVTLLALGGDRLALAALDESDAIGATAADDGLFDVGTGIGNDLLRAHILGRLGERSDALARLDRIRAARPFAPSIVAAADGVQTAIDGDLAVLRSRLDARAAIDPEAQRLLFLLSLLEGRLADAATAGDQISLREPKMRGNWLMVGGPSEAEQTEQKAGFLGLRAYVAGAQGNDAKAAALFGEARAEIAAYVGEDPRTKERFSQSKVDEYLTRAAKGREMQKMLADCDALIGVRKAAASLTFDTLTARLQAIGSAPHMLVLGVEIMRNIGGEPGVRTAIADQATRGVLRNTLALDPGDIGAMLPPAEYLPHVPRFKSSPSMLLWGGGAGWSSAKEGDGSIRTVRYENWAGSRAMMEEMLLLATAQMARAEGYDGFVVLANRSFSRQTTTSGMWTGTSTHASGFEAQARIQLVRSAGLPAELAAAPDRVITVERIERELWPRYQGYFDRQAAIKEAKKEAKRQKT